MHHPASVCVILLIVIGCASTNPPGEAVARISGSNLSDNMKSNTTTLPSAVFNWNEIAMQTTKSGQRRTFFRSPTATLDELEVHVTTLNPGEQAHPPHRHPHEEMMFLKEGTLEANINGQPIPMPTGSALFIAPNDLHNVKNVGTSSATYFVVTWKTPKTVVAK